MTLDEAIKDLEYGTKQLEMEIKSGLWIKGSEPELSCKEGIALNKQHIEWLTELKDLREIIDACNILAVDAFAVVRLCKELKEAKRLLKLAVDDFSEMYDHIYDCDRLCETCMLSGERDHCYKWRYADEVMKLIGGSENAE